MKCALPIFPALILALPSCQTVEGTGRRQLNFYSIESEISMGTEAYDQMLAGERVIASGSKARMVERIGNRVAQAAVEHYPKYASRFDWEFKLIDGPKMVNAWALPGGKCAVYTGLLPVTQDEDSLAVVMGHEVAHAILRHGGERMSQNTAIGIAMAGATIALKDRPKKERNSILGAMGVGSTIGIMLPFSRDHESEADEIGLMLSASAGYDPRKAIGLWERMATAGGTSPPEWLSTHPSSKTRIKRLNKVMPEALKLYVAAGGQL
ncbi:MAG: M48 family metallopeptidase [Planctomycetes bacterium]|nr:M48 family metallopeptidase [Planctomycetota bacterium]